MFRSRIRNSDRTMTV